MNRRIRRLQDRMMRNPKFVEELRRFNNLPTNDEMEKYIEKKKEEPEQIIQPFTTSEDTIKDYYKIK